MSLRNFHHVAFRCRDAQETVDFYTKVLGLTYSFGHIAMSRHDDKGVMFHIFFQLGDGSSLAFFDLPESPPMGADPNTPDWVQHIAFEVDTMEELRAARERLIAAGVEVEGSDVKVGKSITSVYFKDPSGHRLELCVSHHIPGETLLAMGQEALAKWGADPSVAARRAVAGGPR